MLSKSASFRSSSGHSGPAPMLAVFPEDKVRQNPDNSLF